MKNLKSSYAKMKRKEKKGLSLFYSSERNSAGPGMVASTHWHQTIELTVVLSLSAWELLSNVQNLKKKKDAMQQGRKKKQVKKIGTITSRKKTHQDCA